MLKDDREIPAMLPTSGVSDQDPESMEQLFNPNRTDPPQGTPPGGRMLAQSPGTSSDVGDEAGAPPPTPERAPGAEIKSLVNPDDSRYQDPQNLLMGNVLTSGMLPWAQAASDVASGRVPVEKFDEVRMEHQRRLEELKEQHPDFVSAAEKAMPFLEGLGMGALKPAKTVAGTIARGAATAAPQGAARGYTSGPVEEPSGSGKRAVGAVGGAATDAAIGAAGASVPALIGGAKSLIGKVTSVRAERAAATAEAAKATAEGEKKAATAAKAAKTRDLKAKDKEFEARLGEENTHLTEQFQRHSAAPANVSQHWEQNRKGFIADPEHAFREIAKNGWGLEGFSRAMNLPQRAILERMAGKSLKINTPGEEKLIREMLHVDQIGKQFTARGLTLPKAKADAPPAPPAPPAATNTNPVGSSVPPTTPKPPATPKPKAPPKSKAEPKPKAAPKPKAPASAKPKKRPDYIMPKPGPTRPQGRK